MLATRARALLYGRMAPSIEDVQALAEPILKHRMALNFAARAEGVDLPTLIHNLLHRLKLMRVTLEPELKSRILLRIKRRQKTVCDKIPTLLLAARRLAATQLLVFTGADVQVLVKISGNIADIVTENLQSALIGAIQRALPIILWEKKNGKPAIPFGLI